MRKLLLLVAAAAICLLSLRGSLSADPGSVYGTIGPIEVSADGLHYLEGGAGFFDVLNRFGDRAYAARIELRIGKKLAFIGPAVGVIANEAGGWFGYTGIYADFVCGRIVLTPLLAVGAYRPGSGIDLGGTFEFRESLGVAYRFTDRWRAGISIAHVSNAHLHQENPGQQDILVNCAYGF